MVFAPSGNNVVGCQIALLAMTTRGRIYRSEDWDREIPSLTTMVSMTYESFLADLFHQLFQYPSAIHRKLPRMEQAASGPPVCKACLARIPLSLQRVALARDSNEV